MNRSTVQLENILQKTNNPREFTQRPITMARLSHTCKPHLTRKKIISKENGRNTVSETTANDGKHGLGPVQTSCFCRAELKFDKSTAEAWRLNQTFELSLALS